MSQASLLSSFQIANLDLTPPVQSNTGEGAPGFMRRADGIVTAVSADTTSSVYKLVRLPSNAKIKEVKLWSAVASAGAANINLYYSDSAADGTSVANQGTVAVASLFGAAASLVAQTAVDTTFAGSFTHAHQFLPLWQVVSALGSLGWTLDPGGMFDIVFTVTTAITTGGVIYLAVTYVE